MLMCVPSLLKGQPGAANNPGSTQGAVVTTLVSLYTYPTAISANGMHVAGTQFGGGASYYWSAATGLINMTGDMGGVSDNGKGAGAWSDPALVYNGSNVTAAGTWLPATGQWTFLGMNPGSPSLFATDYNVGYDITADGTAVVGMQYYPGYVYSAFKLTDTGGYTNIGAGVGQGSHASGISGNGQVVFGWAEFPAASRTPVIWDNGLIHYIDNSQYGEGFGSSTGGNYVTGTLGNQGFLWSLANTVLFSNTLVPGGITPTTVLNNGTVFGYTNGVPPTPPKRRAFVRDSTGTLMTFNDYAFSRGMTDAQQWTFYSINDASEDGNKFIGAGINPQGQAITFLIEFYPEYPVFTAVPASLEFGNIPAGSQSAYQSLAFTNTGTGNLILTGAVLSGLDPAQFLLNDGNTYPLTLAQGDTARVGVAFKPATPGSKSANVYVSINAGNQSVPVHGTGGYYTGTGETVIGALSLFPNPAQHAVTITGLSGGEELKLYDITGRSLLEDHCQKGGSFLFPVPGLAPGIYLLRVETPDGNGKTLRLMVKDKD